MTPTILEWQAAIAAVKYNNTSDAPNTRQRTVSVRANDGAATNNLSNIESRQISITAVNDPPALANLVSSVTYQENAVNATPAQIDNDVTLADVDSANSIPAMLP